MSLLSFKEVENEKLDGVWVIKELWVDQMENRDAYGYKAIGFVSSEGRARQICNSSYIPTSFYPWPLEVSFGKNKEIPEYKAVYLPCLDFINLKFDEIPKCHPMEAKPLLSEDGQVKKINERNKKFWEEQISEWVKERLIVSNKNEKA